MKLLACRWSFLVGPNSTITASKVLLRIILQQQCPLLIGYSHNKSHYVKFLVFLQERGAGTVVYTKLSVDYDQDGNDQRNW